MRNLAGKFFSREELGQIEAAVQAAEKTTSGEIVCLIQSASYHYPMANVIGAAALSLPLSLAAAPLAGAWLWLGPQNMWLFLSLFAVCFPTFYFVIGCTPRLKRLFVSQREMDEEVQEGATTRFFMHGLYRTREANGVLLFISIFERKVWVLADHGIHARIPQDQWQSIVDEVTRGFKHHRPAESVCQAVRMIGQRLQTHFPSRDDDTNELDNVIIPERSS
jgi:putative membrane protein